MENWRFWEVMVRLKPEQLFWLSILACYIGIIVYDRYYLQGLIFVILLFFTVNSFNYKTRGYGSQIGL